MDRETVRKGVCQCLLVSGEEHETQCWDCPYFEEGITVEECKTQLRMDFIAMMKDQELLEKQEPAIKSSVKQDDIAGIMNAINGALLDNGLHYVATGYDNTGPWLSVMIEKE